MRLFKASHIGRCLKGLANAIVLLLLLALSYWGHHHHWKIPTFSGLIDSEPTETAGVTVPETRPLAEAVRHQVRYRPTSDENAAGRALVAGERDANELDGLPVICFDSHESVRVAGIESSPVLHRPMEEFVDCHGVVDYDHTKMARLSTRVSGIIWRVEKSEGEPVRKGDVLALIDSAKVGQAKAEFLEAAIQCKLREQTLKRLRGLGDVVAGRRLVEAEADRQAAQIRRLNAEQAMITLGLPVDIDESSPEFVEQLVADVKFLGLPESIIATILSQTRSANLLPLTSPLDGIVIRRDVVRGEVVDTSKTLFVVADVSHMWLDLNVRADDARSLAIGQDVLVPIDSLFGDVTGKVVWISTEVDATTRTIKLRARIPNPSLTSDPAGPHVLRAKTYVNARIRVRSLNNAIAVPTSALRYCWGESCHVVFVPVGDGTRFQPRRVKTGFTRDGRTQIQSGLRPGDSVVTSGSRLLHVEMLEAIAHQSEEASKVPRLVREDQPSEDGDDSEPQGL